MVYRHKATGWTRTYEAATRAWTITPTDESGTRTITFTSDPDDEDVCDVVILAGDPLPAWAVEWLQTVECRSRARALAELQAQLHDADMNEWYGRGNW